MNMSNALLIEGNEEQTHPDDQWSMAQGIKNGKPLLVRYRSERPQGVDVSAFPFLLSATWTFQPNEFGLPSSEEMVLMDKFEDVLATSLEGSKTAYLMVILTGNSERDWLWYTCGEDDAMRRVNHALKSHKPYPVQFSVQQDRAWRAYTQFVAGNGKELKERGVFEIIRLAVAKAIKIVRG